MSIKEKLSEIVAKKKCKVTLDDTCVSCANLFWGEMKKIAQDSLKCHKKNFVEEIIKDNVVQNTSVLPEGTRFSYQNNSLVFFVIEQRPQQRTILYESIKGNGVSKNFRLSFPYIIFIPVFTTEDNGNSYNFSRISIAYRNKPLESLEDMLYNCNLPNVGASLAICMGNNFDIQKNNKLQKTKTLSKRIDEAISQFWNLGFNTDLNLNYEEMGEKDERIRSFQEWELNSKENPLFILDINWEKDITISDFFKVIIKEKSDTVIAKLNTSISKIYNEFTKDVSSNASSVTAKKIDKKLKTLIEDRIKEYMEKFMHVFGDNISVIGGNPTLIKTIELALVDSIKNTIL